MEASYLLHLTTLPGLVAIGIAVVEIKYFWFITWPHVPHVQGILWLNGLKFLKVSHHFVTLYWGHRSCDSSYTVAKIAYMTL